MKGMKRLKGLGQNRKDIHHEGHEALEGAKNCKRLFHHEGHEAPEENIFLICDNLCSSVANSFFYFMVFMVIFLRRMT